MKPDGAARRTVLRTAASLSLGAVVLLAAAAAGHAQDVSINFGDGQSLGLRTVQLFLLLTLLSLAPGDDRGRLAPLHHQVGCRLLAPCQPLLHPGSASDGSGVEVEGHCGIELVLQHLLAVQHLQDSAFVLGEVAPEDVEHIAQRRVQIGRHPARQAGRIRVASRFRVPDAVGPDAHAVEIWRGDDALVLG